MLNVILHRDYLPHIVEKRADARERFAHYILPSLQDPLEVWLTQYDDGSYRRRFIALFEESKRQSLVIARENRDARFGNRPAYAGANLDLRLEKLWSSRPILDRCPTDRSRFVFHPMPFASPEHLPSSKMRRRFSHLG